MSALVLRQWKDCDVTLSRNPLINYEQPPGLGQTQGWGL